MAYSNYGAYVWKNGEDITKECADKGFCYLNNKWLDDDKIDDDEIPSEISLKLRRANGHAVLDLGDYFLTFYKIYNPIIISKKENFKEELIFDGTLAECEFVVPFRNDIIEIDKMSLNSHNNIIRYIIKYKEDVYSVIIGDAFGNGWDSRITSKFIKKYWRFDFERKYYFLDHEWEYRSGDTEMLVDYLRRKDEKNDEKYWMWRDIKSFIKSLLKLRIGNIIFFGGEIKDHLLKIKLLK